MSTGKQLQSFKPHSQGDQEVVVRSAVLHAAFKTLDFTNKNRIVRHYTILLAGRMERRLDRRVDVWTKHAMLLKALNLYVRLCNCSGM
jgi:hypothetical protein